MIKYFKIPANAPFDEIAFRDRYLEVTGEAVQAAPTLNTQETHLLFGSSRISADEAALIAGEFPLISVTDSLPSGWQRKEQ